MSKTNCEIGRILSQIAGRSRDLEFLPISSRKHFNFRSDGAFVVVQALEIKAKPVIFVAAFVSQQHSWPVILRNQQVSRTVVVEVPRDDGARIFQHDLVEANIGRDVFETIRAKIAEETNLARPFFRLANSNEVDPAIVVVIDGCDAETEHPVRRREGEPVRSSPMIIAPECTGHLRPSASRQDPSSRRDRNRGQRPQRWAANIGEGQANALGIFLLAGFQKLWAPSLR